MELARAVSVTDIYEIDMPFGSSSEAVLNLHDQGLGCRGWNVTWKDLEGGE